jgi:hypothetical protein
MRRVALHCRHSLYLDLPSWKRGVGRAPFGAAGVDPGSRTLATIADENGERESGCFIASSGSSGVSALKTIASRRRGRRRLAANIFTKWTDRRESSHSINYCRANDGNKVLVGLAHLSGPELRRLHLGGKNSLVRHPGNHHGAIWRQLKRRWRAVRRARRPRLSPSGRNEQRTAPSFVVYRVSRKNYYLYVIVSLFGRNHSRLDTNQLFCRIQQSDFTNALWPILPALPVMAVPTQYSVGDYSSACYLYVTLGASQSERV